MGAGTALVLRLRWLRCSLQASQQSLHTSAVHGCQQRCQVRRQLARLLRLGAAAMRCLRLTLLLLLLRQLLSHQLLHHQHALHLAARLAPAIRGAQTRRRRRRRRLACLLLLLLQQQLHAQLVHGSRQALLESGLPGSARLLRCLLRLWRCLLGTVGTTVLLLRPSPWLLQGRRVPAGRCLSCLLPMLAAHGAAVCCRRRSLPSRHQRWQRGGCRRRAAWARLVGGTLLIHLLLLVWALLAARCPASAGACCCSRWHLCWPIDLLLRPLGQP